jgi:hypothetical protein
MDHTLADIAYKYKSLTLKQHLYTLKDILKQIFDNMNNSKRKSDIYSAYIYVLPDPSLDGCKLIKQPTRLYLTMHMIQCLINQFETFIISKLQLEVFHPLDTKKDAYDRSFVLLDAQKNLQYNPEPNFYITIAPHSSEWYSPRFPKSYYDTNKFTETRILITPGNIHLRSDSDIMKAIKESAAASGLDNLDEDEIKAIQDLLAIVSIDKIKSLTQILDPNWKHKSKELQIAFELQEQVLINGYGNKCFKFKGRMYQYLHEKYPDMNPLQAPQEDEKNYNAETRRMATLANPDKKD